MGKIKQFIESERGKDVLVVLIVIFIGVTSFMLGRLSNNNRSSGVKIEYSNQPQTQSANVISSLEYFKPINKSFFASNKGRKYYSLGCSGGKIIKQENRIYFESKEQAEGAGYEFSNSCK